MKNYIKHLITVSFLVGSSLYLRGDIAPVVSCYDTVMQAIAPSLSSLQGDGIISPLDKWQTALSILKEAAILENKVQPATLSETTISDLGLLFHDVSNPDFTILKKLARTQTVLGQATLAGMLITPTTDIDVLMQRQNVIRFFVENDDVRESLYNLLTPLAEKEERLLALWNPADILYSKNLSLLLFGGNIRKKQSATGSEINRRFFDFFDLSSPVLGYLAADFTKQLVVQHPTGNWKEKLFDGFNASMTALGFAIAWKTFLSKYKARRRFIADLRQRFNSLSIMGETCLNIATYGRQLDGPLISAIHEIQNFNSERNKDIFKFFKSLSHASFRDTQSSSRFQDHLSYWAPGKIGPLLSAVPRFFSVKERLTMVLKSIGELDALLSIAILVKEYMGARNHYCFPTYEHSEDKPHLRMLQFWHPHFDNGVPNDIEMGGKRPRNEIVTGPNGGGKSNYTKGTVINTILAQSFTIAAAESMELTPFALINTYLNIVQNAGKNISQHRAEARRARILLDQIKALVKGQFALTTIDEMFRCTNPKTGACGSYAMGKELGPLPHSLLILATHFFHVTKLADEPELSFENHSVSAIPMPGGGFTYPFRVVPGINKNVIAIDIIAHDKAFNQEILDYAYEHLKRVESPEEAEEYVDNLKRRTALEPAQV